MRSYSVTEFRENLASALDRSAEELVIVRRNGREYEIRPRKPAVQGRVRSGLDVPGVSTASPVTLDSLLDDIGASRARD